MASPPNQPIALRPMRHQSYVQRPKEDWAGITDQKTRKKLQNRLNQRARRSRQPPPPKTVDQGAAALYTNKEEATNEEEKDDDDDDDDELMARVVVQKRALLARFALEATQSYVTNRPDTDQLLRVVKLNTINALTANATALQLPGDWLMCRAISPIGLAGPLLPVPVTTGGRGCCGGRQRQRQRCCYPASLTPTPLQLRIPHHPWIDLLPLPRMRDNWLLAIYVQERLTEEDEVRLWEDLVEWDGAAAASLVVWGEPSDPRSWEATVPFLRQWGRLLDGGEQTAAQLEANLTNLESKLDAMLAAFEQQGGQGQGSAGNKTSSNSNGGGGGNSSSSST
ncbi:hypothetical protein BBO_01469 [Beauveria brongniartii RCEF 3172]|uniref:Uncharacterized protein n=1 Tax=Beauveria brongniartii RCEF 3172 TaxID=1081107 RepID=A0A162KE73_9HYPO|nr:hypothetical protein BBO_01469 [Beauveria brongniartii RCEF 3172]